MWLCTEGLSCSVSNVVIPTELVFDERPEDSKYAAPGGIVLFTGENGG